MRICEPLGVRALLYVDPELVEQMRPQWERRNELKVHSASPNAKRLGRVTVARVLPQIASEMGRRGHLARMKSTTPAQRRAIGRLGAEARWQGRGRRWSDL
jgi:hypothetical protein